MQKAHILVGMSGGVDSSVAAWLLQQQGYRISGVFMRNWEADNDDPYCTLTQDLTDAHAVCQHLGIPFTTVPFAHDYWERVFQHFLDEYAAGRTPNPDILCNQEIKFKAFLDYALAQGADYIATGHYARRHVTDDQHYQLLKGQDAHKDQSYFLYTLQQHQLAHSLFPLGDLTKAQVRAIARDIGLNNHDKKDSTGICFIGERNFKRFLSEYLLARPGTIETSDGAVIGQHDGLMFYTLGQRQGLGIGGRKNADTTPWYVLDKDITRNVLIVGQSHDHPLLYKTELQCTQAFWVAGHAPQLPLTCTAKTRYRQTDSACIVDNSSATSYHVRFTTPQRAITPGQSVVFYQGDICLGGAIIT